MQIDISQMNKAKVLVALFNRATPLGLGFLHYNPADMTEMQAQTTLDEGQTYFDYVQGRVMKVNLGGDSLDPALYDRDNGKGAARKALVEAGLIKA